MEITREVAAKVLTIVDVGLSGGLGERRPGFMCVEAAVCYALDLPHGDDPGCVALGLRSLKLRLNDAKWSTKKARAKGLRRLALAQLGSKGALDEEEFRKRVVDLALRKSVPCALRSAASVLKDEKHKAKLYEVANRCEKEGTREAALAAKAAYVAAAYAAADDDAAAAAYVAAAYVAAAAAAAAAYVAAAAAAAAAAYVAAAYVAAAAAYVAADDDAADAAAAAAAYAADAAAAAAAYAADAAAAAAAAGSRARDKALSEYAEEVVQILIELKAPGCQWLDLTELNVA